MAGFIVLALIALTTPAAAQDVESYYRRHNATPESASPGRGVTIEVSMRRVRKKVRARHPTMMRPATPLPKSRPAVSLVPAVASPPSPLPVFAPLTGFAVPVMRTIQGFIESLIRPVGNCRAFETVDRRVKVVVADAARYFGGIAEATSCYRSPAHNARVRGARNSQHIARKALDFRIRGVATHALAKYVRSHIEMRYVGGVGLYCGTFIHVDVGGKRNWNWCGGRRRRSV